MFCGIRGGAREIGTNWIVVVKPHCNAVYLLAHINQVVCAARINCIKNRTVFA